MDKEYWYNFYKSNVAKQLSEPSLFAKYAIKNHIKKNSHIVEIGCGNGRDSLYFCRMGCSTTSFDQAPNDFLNQPDLPIEFVQADFTKLQDLAQKTDYIYSRFSLHSIEETDEIRVLTWIKNQLKPTGKLLIEARSINDPKLSTGKRLSKNENIVDGHYRRYFDKKNSISRIERAGFSIIYAEESVDFAPFGNENPPILRIVAELTS